MGSSGSGGDLEVGFAKLQGEDFEYFMQTYSITLGRSSKNFTVDVDLSSLGGGMNISRLHARIFYDFQRRRFALEVVGKNGCLVEGVHYYPNNPPVKLDSQDLLQMGDKKFYFLLPNRSILGGYVSRYIPPHHPPPHPSSVGHLAPGRQTLPQPPSVGSKKKGPAMASIDYLDKDDYDDDVDDHSDIINKKLTRPGQGNKVLEHGGHAAGKTTSSMHLKKKGEARSRVERDTDNLELQQLEEKDVVSSVATVLSDLCGPGEWMPLAKLHAELVDKYSDIWHHTRVRRYLTSEDWPAKESKGRPWFGLLTLLRKYPEHFVINTRSKGRVTLEFVSLVALLS